MALTSPKYAAFISYSHADYRAATKLAHRLGTYRLPKGLDVKSGHQLGDIFIDRDTLAAAHSLTDAIIAGLNASQTLIVICSPAAVASNWVAKEIAAFRKYQPDGQILAAIVAGDPAARAGAEACFPKGLIADDHEPLAADLRTVGDGWHHGVHKLAAAIADVPLERLLRRAEARRNRQVMAITAIASTIALSMTVLAGAALSARADARAHQAEAEGLVDFMLGDLKTRLTPVGRLEVLEDVAREAQAYYDRQAGTALTCAAIVRKVKAYHLTAEILQGKHDLEGLAKAAADAETLLQDPATKARCTPDPDFRYETGNNYYWLADPFFSEGQNIRRQNKEDLEAYESYYRRVIPYYEAYRDQTKTLIGAKGYEDVALLEQGYAEHNIGSIYASIKETEKAYNQFQISKSIFESILPSNEFNDIDFEKLNQAQIDAVFTLADANGWLAILSARLGHHRRAIEERERELSVYTLLNDPEREARDWDIYASILNARRGILDAKLSLGEIDKRSPEISRLLDEYKALTEHDPENSSWVSSAQIAQQLLDP